MNNNMSLALFETEKHINNLLLSDNRVIVSVDGMSGSGKTTFAEQLRKRIPATVIHMDHFFLRPEQRTQDRLNTPGGNADFERLIEEVMTPIQNHSDFIYRPFNCHTMYFDNAEVITPEKLIILEGSYSCHPVLFDYCNLHVFLYTDKISQITRILKRSGYDKAKTFISKWIPFENIYFNHFHIKEKCDLKFYI